MAESSTVFFLRPFEGNKDALEIVNAPLNAARKCDDPQGGRVPCLRIGLDQKANHAPRLVSLGRNEESDIILGMNFSRLQQCYFDFNPDSGQLLLHNTDAKKKTRLLSLVQAIEDGKIVKRRGDSVMAPGREQCAVVLAHGREYILELRKASFELFAPTRSTHDEDYFTERKKIFADQADDGIATQGNTALGSLWKQLGSKTETTFSVSSTHTYNLRYKGELQPKPDQQIRYIELEPLGQGGQGKVCKVVDLHDGNHYACKTIVVKENVPQLGINSKSDFRKLIEKEVSLVKKLRNDNIVPYLYTQGFGIDEDIHIFMPLYEGNLRERLNVLRCKKPEMELYGPRYSRQEEIPKTVESMTACMFHQILDALQFVHAQAPAIVHGDVKPGNILCQGGHFVLADFGLAHVEGRLRGRYGTKWFMAPELGRDDNRTTKVDIFGLGVTIVECLFKVPLEHERYHMSEEAWYTILFDRLNHHSTFYASMLAEEPQSRPTAQELAKSQDFLSISQQADCARFGSGRSPPTSPASRTPGPSDKMRWRYSYNSSSQ
ncbi:kinase-like domain-containing protein [Xylaria sp. FL0043]|nr:kinase-like domain-containing protein [Xylaria sp. FL0043]